MNTTKNIKRTKKVDVPEPTLKRMPTYTMHLKALLQQGVVNISAPAISEELHFDPTQIVKDFAFTGVKGKPKVGYSVVELIHSIEKYLGVDKKNEAFLIGAGKLGQAILSYHALQGFGINIIAAFDVDKSKVDTQYGNIQILHFDKLGELAKRLGVGIGILTVPGSAAQEAAEAMVKSGITAIWNLTPAKLRLSSNIIVQDTAMYSDVAVLLHKLNS